MKTKEELSLPNDAAGILALFLCGLFVCLVIAGLASVVVDWFGV